jgi:hypothetical protein
MKNLTHDSKNICQRSKKLWWIASYPRSGNTWVRKFIDAYVTGRVELNNHFSKVVHGDLASFCYQNVSSIPLKDVPRYQTLQMRGAALCQHIALGAGNDVILKTHHANVSVDGIPLIPPMMTNAVVYLVRDPRDVVISWSHHTQTTIEEAVNTLNNEYNVISSPTTGLYHAVMSWSDHARSWLTDNDIPTVMVRYEDLLEKPEYCFAKILTALGFTKINEERLQFALKNTTFSKLQELEKQEGFEEKLHDETLFFRKGKAGQWESELDLTYVKKIQDEHNEMMKYCGYDLID